jgi:outer membrane lipoprotein-sorting protein
MSRRSLGVLILAVFAVAGVRASAQQQPPSADEIVAKNLAAKGGLEKMKAVQTMKKTSRLSTAMPGGQAIEGTLTMYSKRPNLSRQEVNLAGQTVVTAFDGQTAWTIDPMRGLSAPTPLSGPFGEATKEQSEFDDPFVDYQARGFAIELVGTEAAGDRKFYHLRVTSKDHKVQHVYVDTVTSLESKVVSELQTPQGKWELEQRYSDFRDVDGLKVPFSIQTFINGTEQATVKVDKVEFNAKFDDSVFKMPK